MYVKKKHTHNQEMEPKATTIIIFSIVTSLSSLPSLMAAASSSNKTTYITAVFGFGDSTIDTGNNNYLPTNNRAAHPPYGIDFPTHIPNGRVSNGKLAIDFIASSLAHKIYMLPYLDPKLTDHDLLTGACFASAGSGLDPLTGMFDNVLNISTQLDLFDEALRRIERLVGDGKARFIVENALFFFSVGTNDLLNNFYNVPVRTSEFTISGYQDFLLHKLEYAIKVFNLSCLSHLTAIF